MRILTETEMFSQHFHGWLVVIEDQLHKHPKLLIILGSFSFSICFWLFMLTFRNTHRRVSLHWNFSTIFHSGSLKSAKMNHSSIIKDLFSFTFCSDLTEKLRGHLLLSHCHTTFCQKGDRQEIPAPEKTASFAWGCCFFYCVQSHQNSYHE